MIGLAGRCFLQPLPLTLALASVRSLVPTSLVCCVLLLDNSSRLAGFVATVLLPLVNLSGGLAFCPPVNVNIDRRTGQTISVNGVGGGKVGSRAAAIKSAHEESPQMVRRRLEVSQEAGWTMGNVDHRCPCQNEKIGRRSGVGRNGGDARTKCTGMVVAAASGSGWGGVSLGSRLPGRWRLGATVPMVEVRALLTIERRV